MNRVSYATEHVKSTRYLLLMSRFFCERILCTGREGHESKPLS